MDRIGGESTKGQKGEKGRADARKGMAEGGREGEVGAGGPTFLEFRAGIPETRKPEKLGRERHVGLSLGVAGGKGKVVGFGAQ